MARVDLSAHIRAPRETVWEVLTDSDAWSTWSAEITHSVRVSEGESHPDGVGALRELWAAGLVPLREEVLAFDPERGHYAYRLQPLPPVRFYRADVHLSAVDGGTDVSWTVEVRPTLPVPGLGAVLARLVGLVIGRLLGALTAESERRATAALTAA